MGVDIDTAGHDNLALCIDDLCRGADLVNNLAVLDCYIANNAVHFLGRVDNEPALNNNFS